MPTRRPPVISEIAKAYQNDPRTLIANSMMAQGTSGAPVAAGQYGMADGIARMLTGIAGAYTTKKNMDRYGGEEADLLALRKARGVDGLSGAGQPPPLPAQAPPAPPPPPVAAAAAALGAPAPPPPQGPPMAPPGPPLAPPGPTAPPVMGGGPRGRPPFGRSPAPVGGVPSPFAPPQEEAVPDAPAPVARPVAPEPVGRTRSRLLDAAYKIMADGNPYESAGGQEAYMSGLSDQTKLDESAAERRQHVSDMTYQSDLGVANEAASQDRGAKINERLSVLNSNRELRKQFDQNMFNLGIHKDDQAFTAHENALNRSSAMAVARVRSDSSLGGSTSLSPEERAALSAAVADKRIDLKGLTKFQAKVAAQALVDNPDLDAIHLHAYATLAGNPAAQQKAMLLEAMPSIVGQVRDAGKKMKFNDLEWAGRVQAWAKGKYNDKDFTNYMTQRNDAMLTLAQVMSGVGASDMRVRMEAEAAPKTMSPRAFDGWYDAQMSALHPRMAIAEKRGLVEPGTTAKFYGGSGAVAPGGMTDAQRLAKYGIK